MSYDERLDKLDIERLELRRLHFDLITCFKILHNYVDLPAEDFFTRSNVSFTRGHSYKLQVPNSRIDVRLHFFSVRIVNVWNKLPEELIETDSVTLFTKLLKNVDLSEYMIGKE